MVDFGAGPIRAFGGFVASYAQDGVYRWVEVFANTLVTGVAAAAGNTYINGYTLASSIDLGGGNLDSVDGTPQPDQILASFSAANGSYRWAHRFGNTGDEFGQAIAADGSGNVYMTGEFDDADYGGGALVRIGTSRDIVLASYDGDGIHRWSVSWDALQAPRVVLDGSDNVYVTGTFNDVAPVNFGGAGLTSAGGEDALLVSLQSDGTFRSSMRYGDAADQSGRGVALDGSGIYMCVDFEGAIDFGDGAHTAMGADLALAKLAL